ncbi:porin family protein [Xanthovirga aplysinae]|uniref:porin family protein n=1 Tax=Xanthovirga aplysinae TaxID=2529853 RepID=UPI0012BBA905|nr:porin family protein [Xanthovirga aplysinae]MTI30488.1 PorT family protein [Xanthovirga aplysinae]
MKKLLLFIFCISIIPQAFSQVNFKVKAGINYVGNYVMPSELLDGGNLKYRFGYHFGLGSKFNLNENFILNSELLFSNKGTKIQNSESKNSSGNSSLHLNYLNLPIMIGYKTNKNLSFLAGPELGYLLSARGRSPGSEPANLSFLYNKKLDLGLAAGISYLIGEKIEIELRYIHGFLPVMDKIQWTDENGNLLDPSNSKEQNRTFQLSVGFLIGKKMKNINKM